MPNNGGIEIAGKFGPAGAFATPCVRGESSATKCPDKFARLANNNKITNNRGYRSRAKYPGQVSLAQFASFNFQNTPI
jgi:hypothetical protein